ncbi:MAG TPA: DUF4159 domain-containing protein [Bryobacteraceae bacterium]|jgi:hypothetical protein|nr:DUF4159 domain-containing protein [Bryobacteraceae bacterium]
MRFRFLIGLGILGLLIGGVVMAQKPFKQYPAIEYYDFPLPKDYKASAEWTRARLRYPDIYGYPDQMLFNQDGSPFPGYWTMDYPRSDRHLLEGVRRLTRIDARSVEQVVSFDGSDDMFNYPMLYAVEVGHWRLHDENAKQLREFLLRGGFLMVDDFHGTAEWRIFKQSMDKVFPDRPIVEIDKKDPIFHILYDLDESYQVPGSFNWFENKRTFEKDGYQPEWRGIVDDKGRVMVAICHNMDLGDGWENSDDPRYPEKYAGFAYKVGLNYFIYDLTH